MITHKLHFTAGDVGDVHVMGGRAKIFQLLASEDINSNKMDLSVTVLASLGSGHVDDLARASLNHNVTVLAKSRTLHGIGGGGAGIGALEGVLMLFVRNGQQHATSKRVSGILKDSGKEKYSGVEAG